MNMPSDGFSGFSTMSDIRKSNLHLLKSAIEDIDPKVGTERTMVLLKQIYDICVNGSAANETGPQPLIELMDKALGHHMAPADLILQKHIPSDNVPLEARIAQLWLDLGISSLVSIYIDQDEKNSSKHMLYFGAPRLSLSPHGHEPYLPNDTENDQLVANHFEAMQAFNKMWKYGSLSYKLNDAEILALKKLLRFEQRLALASTVEGGPEEDQYSVINSTVLDDISSSISLALLAKEIAPVDEVIIRHPNFFSNIDGVLEDTPDEIIHAYLAWILLSDQFKYLGSDYLRLHYEYFDDHEEGCQTCGRPYDCLDYMVGDTSAFLDLGMAMGKLFITSSKFDKENVLLVSEMANQLAAAFKQMVNGSTWMDDLTKKKTYEKIDAMRRHIGYPTFIFDSLDKYYLPLLEVQQDFHGTVIDSADSFLEVNHKLTKWLSRSAAKSLLEPPDLSLFHGSPAIANAWYSVAMNAIYIPAGIIQFPLFDKSAPSAVNFGALGSTIAHELIHGLDDYGSNFDANGNLDKWWSEKSTERFYEKVDCMRYQYDKYCYIINDERFCVNGEYTISENIADNGGLRESFIAYKNFMKDQHEMMLPSFRNFTPEQIFFLSYASVYCGFTTDEYLLDLLYFGKHAPMRERVNGALRNFEEFSNAFNCPLGSAMNPVEKCTVW